MSISGLEMYVNYINIVANNANYYNSDKVSTNTNIVGVMNLASDIDDLSDLDKLYKIATGQPIFFSSLDFISTINVDDYLSRIGNIVEDEDLKALMIANCGSLLSDNYTIPTSGGFSNLLNFDDSVVGISEEINSVKGTLTESFNTVMNSIDNEEDDVYSYSEDLDDEFEEPDFSENGVLPKWATESEDDEEEDEYLDDIDEEYDLYDTDDDIEDDYDIEDDFYEEDGIYDSETENIPKWDLDEDSDDLEDDYLDDSTIDGYVEENTDNLLDYYYSSDEETLDYEDIMANGLFSDVPVVPKYELEADNDDDEDDEEYFDDEDAFFEDKPAKWDTEEDDEDEEYFDIDDEDDSSEHVSKWDLEDEFEEDDDDDYSDDTNENIPKESKNKWDSDLDWDEYEPDDDEYLSDSDLSLDSDGLGDDDLFEGFGSEKFNDDDDSFSDSFPNNADVKLYSNSNSNNDSLDGFGVTGSDAKSSEDKLADTILTISKKIEESPTFLKNLFKSVKITDEDLDCIE